MLSWARVDPQGSQAVGVEHKVETRPNVQPYAVKGKEEKKKGMIGERRNRTGKSKSKENPYFCPGDLAPLPKETKTTKQALLKSLFVGRSITKSTNAKHRALIDLFFGCCVTEIIEYFDRQMATRRWVCTTVRTKLGNLLGANSRTKHALFPNSDPQMKDYIKHIDNLCLSHDVKFPFPLNKETATRIAEYLKDKKDDEFLALFALQWSTTARTSDVLLLQKRRMWIANTDITVTFIEGKGVKARGSPYTVATATPFITAVNRQIRESSGPMLFPVESHDRLRDRFRRVLKLFDERLELRSLRRGSLQHMASQGVSLEVLMSFSGHKSRTTLLRYLNWGTFATVMLNDQTSAATLLW